MMLILAPQCGALNPLAMPSHMLAWARAFLLCGLFFSRTIALLLSFASTRRFVARSLALGSRIDRQIRCAAVHAGCRASALSSPNMPSVPACPSRACRFGASSSTRRSQARGARRRRAAAALLGACARVGVGVGGLDFPTATPPACFALHTRSLTRLFVSFRVAWQAWRPRNAAAFVGLSLGRVPPHVRRLRVNFGGSLGITAAFSTIEPLT
jgi:hypothetical protein